MNLQQLLYVVTVHKMKSLSAAAKELYVSQPSLSSAIKDLEEELKIQIFQRTARGVFTTAEGLAFVEKARDVLERFDELREGYTVERRSICALRVITMPCLQANRAFMKFCKDYDEAESCAFAFRTASGNEALIEVAASNYDMGIVYLPANELPDYQSRLQQYSLEFQPLMQMDCYICISKTDPLALRDDLSPENLKEHTHLYNRASAFLNPVNTLFRIVEPESSINRHNRSIQTNLKRLNYELLTGLRSFVFGTTLDVKDFEQSGIACIPSRDDQKMELGIIQMKSKNPSKEFRHFLQLFREELNL